MWLPVDEERWQAHWIDDGPEEKLVSSARSAPSASSVSAEEPVGRSLADGSTAQLKDLPSRRPPREPESRARGSAPAGSTFEGDCARRGEAGGELPRWRSCRGGRDLTP